MEVIPISEILGSDLISQEILVGKREIIFPIFYAKIVRFLTNYLGIYSL
jgi:hypothetical protein